MALDLSRVGKRDELKVRREPHWQRLRAGCFLGFRPSILGGAGSWIARAYDADAGKYRVKSLGDFGALAPNERFTAAKREAEKFTEEVEAGGQVCGKVLTVADACRKYGKDRADAEGRFKRHVYGDPLAKVRLDRLRRHHLRDWRKRLEDTPSLVSRTKKGEKRTRNRASATVNRDMAALRASLNTVLAAGTPNTESAWQEALVAVPNASKRRTLYLDKAQRRMLLEHIDTEAEPFVRALCLLPLRPGALAALTAGDFDKRTAELTVGKDKAGQDRRFVVAADAATLLSEQVANKLPGAPLFTRGNHKVWDKNSWKLPIKAAVAAAGLPGATTAYTLRHSTITDLVAAGLPLLTIAQISGTSAEMIERHYGHLTSDAAVKALGALSL